MIINGLANPVIVVCGLKMAISRCKMHSGGLSKKDGGMMDAKAALVGRKELWQYLHG